MTIRRHLASATIQKIGAKPLVNTVYYSIDSKAEMSLFNKTKISEYIFAISLMNTFDKIIGVYFCFSGIPE